MGEITRFAKDGPNSLASCPVTVPGFTVQRRSHCGKLFVTVTTQEGKPFEVFIRFGKAGGCGSAMADGLARLVSYGLRSGLKTQDAVKAITTNLPFRG